MGVRRKSARAHALPAAIAGRCAAGLMLAAAESASVGQTLRHAWTSVRAATGLQEAVLMLRAASKCALLVTSWSGAVARRLWGRGLRGCCRKCVILTPRTRVSSSSGEA